jgi:hypothetical protein
LDYHLFIPQLLKHSLEDLNERVGLLLFDESAAPLANLSKHIGVHFDDLMKQGRLFPVSFTFTQLDFNEGELDWIGIELPFVNKTTGFWRKSPANYKRDMEETGPGRKDLFKTVSKFVAENVRETYRRNCSECS